MRRWAACHVAVLAALWIGLWLRSPSALAAASWGACSFRHPPAWPARAGCRGTVSKIPRRVRERRRQASAPPNTERDVKKLTNRIVKTDVASELLELLGTVVDSKTFNEYHVSAALTRLAKFKKKRPFRKAEARSPVWAKLASRLHDMLLQDMLAPRGVANVFYAVGELYGELGRPISQVLPELCGAVRAKASGMNCQELLNCLYSAAKLQDAARKSVLAVVSAVVAEVLLPDKMKNMNSQNLSNYLWAAATLQEAAPVVLRAVPDVAMLTIAKVQTFLPQELANCMWAAAKLHVASPGVLTAVPALVKQIPSKVESMKPQELSNCLYAAAILRAYASEVLDAVPAIVRRMHKTVDMMNLQDLPNNLWAVATLKDVSPEALALVPELQARMIPTVSRLAFEGLQMSLTAAQQLKEQDLAARLQAELIKRQR